MVAMLLPFTEDFELIHVSDIFEASLKEHSGTPNRFCYSGRVFTVVS